MGGECAWLLSSNAFLRVQVLCCCYHMQAQLCRWACSCARSVSYPVGRPCSSACRSALPPGVPTTTCRMAAWRRPSASGSATSTRSSRVGWGAAVMLL